MNRIVVDCSVTMAWGLEDESSDYADYVMEQLPASRALVPAIWPLEVGNAIVTAERRKRMTPRASAKFVELLNSLPIEIENVSAALAFGRVIPLARQCNLSVYDASYLELALREGVPLATLDKKLAGLAKRRGVVLALKP